MNQESGSSRQEAQLNNKDITHILKGWDFEPGTVNVRKIKGSDGSPKLQMRLDLGVLQMELTGRPDGARPHGCESLLEFYEQALTQHRTRYGTNLGFQLNGEQCQFLREEAVMYYRRYLSLFVLEDFAGVVRDTARNLRVLDLCAQFGAAEDDRLILEQYRPYLLMMNTRAQASLLYKQKDFPAALQTVRQGLSQIKRFFIRYGQESAYSDSSEVRVLKKFARDIRKKLPVDPVVKLKSLLEKAVRNEHYEEAAKLRDAINRRAE